MATAPKAATKAPAKGAPEASEQQAPVTPKKSKKKLILFMLIMLMLLGVGGGAALMLLGEEEVDPDAPPKAAKQDPAKPPVFMVMDPFTVNLQPDGAGEQFLQLSFSLQVTDQKEVDLIKLYLPQVRSRLLLLFSGKRASEISTPDGKKKLAEEVLAQVNQPFTPGAPPQGVKNVFFTSFVIQ